MNWNGAITLLLAILLAQLTIAQVNEDTESTTISDISNDQPTPIERNIQLDSKLRTALLKALTDLENEENSNAHNGEAREDRDKNVERAQASAVTIFANGDANPTISSSEEEDEDATTNENTPNIEPIAELEEDPSKQTAELVIFQKSQASQVPTITTLENSPLDPFKEAEQIISSASNSFISSDFSHQNEAKSVFVTQNSTSNIQKLPKISSFTSFNSISNSDLKNPSKTTQVEKFSIGKAVDEPNFVKTYIKPLGLQSEGTYVKAAQTYQKASSESVNIKNSVSNDVRDFTDEIVNGGKSAEPVTEAPVEISTEENEAKVEQVQFFSAPLVAAFTVHQDETGQPKKVEPIYKNGIGAKKEVTSTQPTLLSQPSQTILQSSVFNSLDLQQKQHILEQELTKLREEQQNLLARTNFGNAPNFNSIDTNIRGFVNQNFNQFDPVFAEPDRSVVTKLATIDPGNLKQNSGPLLNRFTPNDAIFPSINSNTPNQIVPESKPSFHDSKSNGDVSLVPSISFDPLVEAGKLPLNAQILPNKEPTGFHNFGKLTKTQNQQNFVSLFQPRPQQNVLQPSLSQSDVSNFVGSAAQSNAQNFLDSQQNRFLRQEQGTINPGFNQNTFSIVPAQQPFAPKHELGYFPDNNRFLRQNEAALAQPQQSFARQNLGNTNFNTNTQNTRFFRSNLEGTRTFTAQNQQKVGFTGFPGQNQNRFFRSNLEGSVTKPQTVNIQQSIQSFGVPQLSGSSQGNRFFRSNQGSAVGSPQTLGFSQAQKFPQTTRILRSNQESAVLSNQNGLFQKPVLQNYKYSSSFGFPSIPLH